MQTCGLAPDCAVCSVPGDCPHERILNDADYDEYNAWIQGDEYYQKWLEQKRDREWYGIEEDGDD